MIREYEARDFEDVKYLNDISYSKPCSEQELQDKLSAGKCWVFEDSPLVIGALILTGDLIWSVTVAPNWQRKGIATSLIREAEKGANRRELYTEPNSAGFRLYQKLGYVPAGISKDYYGNSDAVHMVTYVGVRC